MALIVVATSSDRGQMRLVGWMFIDSDVSDGRNVFEDRDEFQTVVLVQQMIVYKLHSLPNFLTGGQSSISARKSTT